MPLILLMVAQHDSSVPECIASMESGLFIKELALNTFTWLPGMRFCISWPNQVAATPWGITSGVSVVSRILKASRDVGIRAVKASIHKDAQRDNFFPVCIMTSKKIIVADLRKNPGPR